MKEGHVYFITDGNAVKIGFSTNVADRLRALQTAHHAPLKLLATIPANREDEAVYHYRFHHLRMNGEWFRDGPELTSFLASYAVAGERWRAGKIDDLAGLVAAANIIEKLPEALKSFQSWALEHEGKFSPELSKLTTYCRLEASTLARHYKRGVLRDADVERIRSQFAALERSICAPDVGFRGH